MSHEDRNTQQAKVAVKENHDKAPAGSNLKLGVNEKLHSEAFHKLKFFFNILLTVHLNIFILILTNFMH